MKIAIASDHAGFQLKAALIHKLRMLDYEISDLGTNSPNESVDYPDFTAAVARAVAGGQARRGIVVCGSGVGACVAANKFKGVRAGLCHDTYSAHQGVEHDDVNVLCLGARVIGESLALEVTAAFLKAEFSGEERHVRRLDKVKKFEEGLSS
ncbi:MAG: ribose 5-phosphate isomerase B [Elusimicrobia bacterium]|nr:MAG: ribose 5-phosphate isomerase B [Elusimicrobiota bacterium]KAF0153889.1 MAG: ribose 5-phosphate isomerase B [Elusimicrobiota bacterium]